MGSVGGGQRCKGRHRGSANMQPSRCCHDVNRASPSSLRWAAAAARWPLRACYMCFPGGASQGGQPPPAAAHLLLPVLALAGLHDAAHNDQVGQALQRSAAPVPLGQPRQVLHLVLRHAAAAAAIVDGAAQWREELQLGGVVPAGWGWAVCMFAQCHTLQCMMMMG